MFEKRKYEDDNLYLLRLTARVFAAICVGVLFLFIFGESSDWSKVTVKQMVGLLFFPVGLITGLIIAWWKEFLGGATVLGSVAAFYLVYGLLLNGTLAQGWWFLVFAIPGALFLAYGIASAGGQTIAGHNAPS